MSKSPGSVFGGIFLITGSCVGAGVLGLPIQTGLSGFLPSMATFLLVWVFMTLSAFLLLEVNSWHPKDANILTMASHSLGKVGRYICWVFYLFLFYSVLVAYMAASGNILSHFLTTSFNFQAAPYQLTCLFVLIFGFFVYLGTKAVDHANRVFMIFKIGAFLLVLLLGAHFVKPAQLGFSDTSKMMASIPMLVIAFGFHNMIPSLTSYMKNDIKKVRKCILGGSLLSLLIYCLWQVLILGIIPVIGQDSLSNALTQGKEASELLSQYLNRPVIGVLAQSLGFFAIVTSFLTQSLSLSHFLMDGLELKQTHFSHIAICLMTLFPPLMLAIFYPALFYIALNFAGGICTVVLFGILPSLMVWRGRYQKLMRSTAARVFGGKPLILFIFFFATSVFFYELFKFARSVFS